MTNAPEFNAAELFTLLEALNELFGRWEPYGADYTLDIVRLIAKVEDAYDDLCS